jgi:hypothetical protein
MDMCCCQLIRISDTGWMYRYNFSGRRILIIENYVNNICYCWNWSFLSTMLGWRRPLKLYLYIQPVSLILISWQQHISIHICHWFVFLWRPYPLQYPCLKLGRGFPTSITMVFHVQWFEMRCTCDWSFCWPNVSFCRLWVRYSYRLIYLASVNLSIIIPITILLSFIFYSYFYKNYLPYVLLSNS